MTVVDVEMMLAGPPGDGVTAAEWAGYTGRLDNVNAVTVNVLDYGAVPNSMSDQRSAILAALAAAQGGGAGYAWYGTDLQRIVLFPPGVYRFTGVIDVPNYVAIRGAGKTSTAFRALDATAQLKFGALTGDRQASASGDFSVDGQSLATHPLWIGVGSHTTFENIEVRGAVTDGITLAGIQNTRFVNVNAFSAGQDNLHVTGGAGGNGFFGCNFGLAGRYDIRFSTDLTAATYTQPTHNQFYGCICEGPSSTKEAGVYLGAGYFNTFSECNFQCGASDRPYWGVMVNMTGAVYNAAAEFRRCTFNSMYPSNGMGLYVYENVAVTLSGNTVFDRLDTAIRARTGARVYVDGPVFYNTVTNRFTSLDGLSEGDVVNVVRAHRAVARSTATTSESERQFVGSETEPRFVRYGDGQLRWGSGAATPDTNLYRRSANLLATDDKLYSAAGLAVGNSVASTTPGSLARKAEVFDGNGVSLGYIYIYSS